MELLKKARQSQWYGVGLLLIVTLACWVVFKLLCGDSFGSPDQMLTYLQTGLIYAVGGCGLYFIVTMGLWDFSVGSVLVLSCLIAIGCSQMFGLVGVVVGPILCGAILGACNGLAYTKLRIPSLNFKPLMGAFFGLAFKKYGHPVESIVIGEFLIAMMFAGFTALGMPITINNIVSGATLLLIVLVTTKRVKGAVVK